MLVNQTMAVKGAAPKTASDYGKIFGAPEDEMYFAAALNPKFEVDGAKNGIRKFTGQRKQFYTAMVVLALGAAVQGMGKSSSFSPLLDLLMRPRRNCHQWRTDLFLPSIRHQRHGYQGRDRTFI